MSDTFHPPRKEKTPQKLWSWAHKLLGMMVAARVRCIVFRGKLSCFIVEKMLMYCYFNHPGCCAKLPGHNHHFRLLRKTSPSVSYGGASVFLRDILYFVLSKFMFTIIMWNALELNIYLVAIFPQRLHFRSNIIFFFGWENYRTLPTNDVFERGIAWGNWECCVLMKVLNLMCQSTSTCFDLKI